MQFIRPNGSAFEIPDSWWKRADMKGFIPKTASFVAGEPEMDTICREIQIVNLADIEPVTRAIGQGGFFEDRLASILEAIRSDTPLPPIKIHIPRTPIAGGYRYRLYHGYHRYYASIAAGFSEIPACIDDEPVAPSPAP